MASINQVAAKDTAEAVHKISQISNKGVLGEFKQFISRGSMVDMAVGVVMGSAVTSVVNAIVNNLISVYFCIIMPINKLRQLSRAASGIKDQPNAPSPQDQTLQLLRQIADDIHQSTSADSQKAGTELPKSQD